MDIRSQYAELLPEVKRAVCDVIDSGRFVLGPQVRALEEEFAAAAGARHAVSVANGTDALVLALEALGIGRGDEVVTSSYTFYATVEGILRAGATPVFADVDPRTLTLDPAAAEAAVGERTSAILPVHIFGQAADMAGMRDVAGRLGLALVEDAAQAFGATFEGRPVGGFGDAATFSFYPTKNLPAMGDGGMVTTSSEDIAERVRMLRFHGSRDKRRFEIVGTNSRLDEMQAAIVRLFLPHVERWNDARRAAAARYRALGLGELVELPVEDPERRHVYHLYVVRSPARDALEARLRAAAIGAAVYYATPLHRQPALASLIDPGLELPATEAASREGLALPMFPTLAAEDQRAVVEAVREALRAAA
jgi:dTDP-4-amino-4,6-dideoxygalactose transaminase